MDKNKYIEELEKDFHRWDDIYKNGCNDPSWCDGVNLNLVRTHILIDKRKIEKNLKQEEYPEIYFKKTPDEVDDYYMAQTEKIKQKAIEYYEKLTLVDGWKELENAYELLDKNNPEQAMMRFFIEYVENLKLSIEEKDYVSMRRLNNSPIDIEQLTDSIALFSSLNITATKQLSLFSM